MRNAARVSLAENRLKQISTGMELYFQQYGSYPPQGSDLVEELTPFVGDPDVFNNPLLDEDTPGETINQLYLAPGLDELDSPNHYLTAMVSDDWRTVITLTTGHRVQRVSDVTFLIGSLNLNPRNNDDFTFALVTPDGSAITRDMLLAEGDKYDEETYVVKKLTVCPKGTGNQNGLSVNGPNGLGVLEVQNGVLYTIEAGVESGLSVTLRREESDSEGRAMGLWWADIVVINPNVTGARNANKEMILLESVAIE